jgi:CBS domain-containing protein
MVAKDIMTRNVITVGATTPVKDLAKLLTEKHVSGVPVTDKDGQILGVASEADMIAKKGNQVREIMNERVIAVTEETTVEELATLMTEHKIKRLPVLREEKLVGIVSRADIVRAIAMGDYLPLKTPVYDL